MTEQIRLSQNPTEMTISSPETLETPESVQEALEKARSYMTWQFSLSYSALEKNIIVITEDLTVKELLIFWLELRQELILKFGNQPGYQNHQMFSSSVRGLSQHLEKLNRPFDH